MAKMTRAEWIEATLAQAPEGAAERFFETMGRMAKKSRQPKPVARKASKVS